MALPSLNGTRCWNSLWMVMAILALRLGLIWGYGGIPCFGEPIRKSSKSGVARGSGVVATGSI